MMHAARARQLITETTADLIVCNDRHNDRKGEVSIIRCIQSIQAGYDVFAITLVLILSISEAHWFKRESSSYWRFYYHWRRSRLSLRLPSTLHDDVIKWKHFPRYWPFVRGIHRSPVNSPHKVQWRGALMFTLICARINGWVNNREAGDLRRYRAHYDVIVMPTIVSDRFIQVINWDTENLWRILCYHDMISRNWLVNVLLNSTAKPVKTDHLHNWTNCKVRQRIRILLID